ncbi:MAG: type II toxin-antitoxin system HipA family toxin [Methylocystis sp.]|nr:type II toxin-antitoxin system HipA family toxin [Methylocystis sp.]
MTSKTRGATECFVYMTLPGETEAVTAGRFELATSRQGVVTGRFVYGRSYLARPNAAEIDPVELKLGSRTYETVLMKGVFGALRDAGPDYWGRRVIEKHAGLPEFGELDYLLHSPDDRAGALSFGLNQTPPASMRRFNQTIDLEKLQVLADALVRDEPPAPGVGAADLAQAEDLLLVGTSMGGARPKVVVEDAEGLWLAKFNRPDDKWNVARVEHTMLTLGQACGLTTAESRVAAIGDREVLLVKRFDREKAPGGYLRARMVSALTMLRADDSLQSRERWSYIRLAEELRRISADPKRDAAELFRRMCFNALISNIDDHPRNHAVIAPDRDWRLSPAYDLTPSSPVSIERRDLAMACGDLGRYANAGNLMSQAARFLLSTDQAACIVDDLEARVRSTWYEVARECGVSDADCAQIAGAFTYPGFRA